jgi:putative ABC transport system permease protein
MLTLARSMLLERPGRLALTAAGIAFTFFLAVAQVGLLVGWCRTTSALIRHANVDLWVMAQATATFDFGTAIPRQRVPQVRSVPGVAWAEAMVVAWNVWQRPDGRRVNIELVGLDGSLAGGPWRMQEGDIAAVTAPDAVVVDELHRKHLGIDGVGAHAEILGRRALVAGLSRGVRTFTASPFVFTTIERAIRYDQRYRDHQITYVLVRCADGVDPVTVQRAILADVPNVDVLTTAEFARKTSRYWMLETGVGVTVVITALLGLIVGLVITSQTLFSITQENLAHYTTLLALGFARRSLLAIVLAQALVLGILGVAAGSLAFAAASALLARTQIPLEMTPEVLAGLVALALASCALASALSVKAIFKIDPAQVFRA